MTSAFFAAGDTILHRAEITIVEKIAQGGMGEVYEATLHGAQGFEKRIALKVVRSDASDTAPPDTGGAPAIPPKEEFLQRLVAEAKLVSNLIHTHIVQIYLYGTADDVPGRADGFIAMEYVNGVNLRSFVDKHSFEDRQIPIEIAVYIASRLTRALEYAHTRTDRDGRPLGIVHRDVSPTNILISVEGVVKLSDFGIAKVLLYDNNARHYVIGKRRYMAPEQLLATGVDFRADIFSAGLILHELLTGIPPDRSKPMEPPSRRRGDVAPELDGIVMRALAERPEDRFAATGDMAIALEKAIYEKGYGPTFVTLADYLRELYPSLAVESPTAATEDKTIIYRRTSDAPVV